MLDTIERRTGHRIIRAAPVALASASKVRSFHRIITDGPPLHVRLTRWAHRGKNNYRLSAYLSDREYPVPRFYGAFKSGGDQAGVWECCEGSAHGSLEAFTLDQVNSLIDGLALIGARSIDVADHARVPTEIRWARPVLTDLLALPQAEAVRPRLEGLLDKEAAILERLQGMEQTILNHNDIVARNVLARDDGSVVIVDWDSASIGPAGASLRAFAALPLAEHAAARYASQLRDHGVSTRESDVLFVMRAQQTFWFLTSGLVKRRPQRIMTGTKRLEQLVL